MKDGSKRLVEGQVYDKDGDIKVKGKKKQKNKKGEIVYEECDASDPEDNQIHQIKLENGQIVEFEGDSYDEEGDLIVKGKKKLKNKKGEVIYKDEDGKSQLKTIVMKDGK